jgi:magnesium chelatase subunit D
VVGRFSIVGGVVTHRQARTFPLSAVVGQETLKAALLLVAVDPAIGGVLVGGHKGTAKSTAVRALAGLLPEISVVEGCRFGCDPDAPEALCDECLARAAQHELPQALIRPALVELPVSATEDRVLGTLDFEHAIKVGERRFEPGLLARANRGVLYVDEVNLLDDNVVDSLLDAAASGINTVEREGVAISHPARFVLIVTMNPEEGEVRPQLLDRFGLFVSVQGLTQADERVEVVRRRAAFEADPAAFVQEWRSEERLLAERIASARKLLGAVGLEDDLLYLIASIGAELGVEGHRADITLARAAAARAALEGRLKVGLDDVRTVAPLALAHRVRGERRREDATSEALARVVEAATAASGVEGPSRPEDDQSAARGPGPEAAAGVLFSPAVSSDALIFDPRPPLPSGGPPPGGHDRGAETRDGGRYVRSSDTAPERASDVALDATVRAAAARGAGTGGRGDGIAVHIGAEDLRSKVRSRRAGACVVFCVDASGSMGAASRMEAAKAAVLDLLVDAYRRRDRVGLVSFRGDRAELVLSPTASIELARMRLADLRTGGTTPLAHGLSTSLDVLDREARRDDDLVPWLVLVTDGRANVGLGGAPEADARTEAARLREAGVRSLVVDTCAGDGAGSAARELAELAGGSYVRLGPVRGSRLSGLVAGRLRSA